MVSTGGGSMAKRVLLVRGGALGRNTGLGAAPVSYTHLTLPTNREV